MNYIFKDTDDVYDIPDERHCLDGDDDDDGGGQVWPTTAAISRLRVELMAVKSQLNDIPLDRWSAHTALTDKSSLIIPALRRQLSRQPFLLTKAWLKMYEMLSELRLIERHLGDEDEERSGPKDSKRQRRQQSLDVLFLCECPGGFVNAINHYMKSHDLTSDRLNYRWLATTLNPYYEDIDYTIVDDRFIRQPMSYPNWWFGPKNTGNILDNDFVDDLRLEMHRREIAANDGFNIVTCDGSINCVDCPERQEEVVLPLVAKEVLTGLTVLASDGSLIVKLFTLFDCQTQCLLYLLCCAFRRLHVFKPTASKSGNSELYVIGLGFKSSPRLTTIVGKLLANECKSRPIFNMKSISDRFFGKLEDCIRYFVDNQCRETANS
ncbi:cap-specific mRNA (nucleoside-2'-O-)-methyltransferase 2-like [Oppia nitens]|uniref:cap-specific mRNA (nucleoside-2'-O-)-methyltransferase 2-like n=1 Tax=Oppia nitens TaxID=1686743 RepID=UPI0023D996F2|nr:cap-specific mRNA (nucleoside-2'-O-)-methyltransferase 2-like [Oppia nitens]